MQTLTAEDYRQPFFESAAFLTVTFLTGIALSLQFPTLSLFLSTQVHARPLLVGSFYTISGTVSILISQYLARRSDRGGQRKTLVMISCVFGILYCLLFAWNRNYWLLVTLGVCLSSVASIATPQIFALARERSDLHGREALTFNSIMRAQISLAWVIGPPVSFALVLGYGFTTMYLINTITFMVCGLMVWWTIPKLERAAVARASRAAAHFVSSRDVKILFVGSTCIWACNGMYLINMPLYLTHELALSGKFPGFLMGFSAGLEIPAMLVAAWFARRFGKRNMILVCICSGFCFYGSLSFISHKDALIALQFLNAAFIGVFANLGMIYFQDLLPGKAGAATTLYTNSIRTGTILAGALVGITSEIWNYHAIFYVAVVLIIAAFVCCCCVREVEAHRLSARRKKSAAHA